MGGGEFARGRQAQGASTSLGPGGGVNAVAVHQGHARSASHWQARSTDLKLSQNPPSPRGRGRCGGQVCQLVRCGMAIWGPQGLLCGVGRSSELGHPADRDRGPQPDGQDKQTAGERGLQWERDGVQV